MSELLRRAASARLGVALVLVAVWFSPAPLHSAYPDAGAVPISHKPAVVLRNPGTPDQQSHLLIIVGIAGEEGYRQSFHEWAVAMIETAESRLGLPSANITYLAEKPETDPDRIDGRSTRENVEAALVELAGRAAPTDQIFILLIGHGSSQGNESRFNLPGPDMTPAHFAELLERFPTQTVAFINSGSASGDFVKHLSGKNRTVITATRDGRQYNETVFARFFVEAFASDVADLDKNERVSLLEAYNYASREVRRFYEDQGRLRTETALLDDNGDGEGSHLPEPGTTDGAEARSLFIAGVGPTTEAAPGVADDPELQALYEDKRALEEEIENLKQLKESMDPELYLKQLEALLVELALKQRAIREKGGAREPSGS